MKALVVPAAYPERDVPEKGFILAELRELAASGVHVVLAPPRGVVEVDPDLPKGVEVTDVYARAFAARQLPLGFLRALCLPDVWRELLAHPAQGVRPRFWKEAIRIAQARKVFGSLASSYDVFYTFWFTGDTLGLAKAGARPLVTRAHGYDLYEDVSANGGHIPFRRSYRTEVDAVVTLGEKAGAYARARFDWPVERVRSIPLGVANQEDRNPGPRDALETVFVSCAFPSANKRLKLIGEVAAQFAQRRPERRVTLCHFGAGMSDVAPDRRLPANLTIDARGAVPRDQVLDYYRRYGVSFFLNLSLSEGQPVSVMEAMSFGIPVVVTSVGGMPEMVAGGGGILVDVSETAAEIAHRISAQPDRNGLGDQARRIQQSEFDAQQNARRLAALLREVVDARVAGQTNS